MTWVVQLTAKEPAAVAVIRLWGPKALEMLSLHWTACRPDLPLRPSQVRLGWWRSQANAAGEQVVVCLVDRLAVEIQCHGGPAAVQAILKDLAACGVQSVTQTQWIEQQGADRLQQQAQEDLMRSASEVTAGVLLDQFRGGLSRELRDIAASIDARAPVDQIRFRLERLHERGCMGCHLIHPWRIVLAGPTNVGKSSLINALLGYERAIVHPQPGTTRDVVEATLAIRGWPFLFQDTAGLRSTDDPIEASGMAAARQRMESADLILLLAASDMPWQSVHEQILLEFHHRVLLVRTKSDLQVDVDAESCKLPRPPDASVSALLQQGISELMGIILQRCLPTSWSPGAAVPFRPQHVAAIDQALDYVSLNQLDRARAVLYGCLGIARQ
jgi:tRNA modification GTPase